jgi:hypothetical protein
MTFTQANGHMAQQVENTLSTAQSLRELPMIASNLLVDRNRKSQTFGK